MFDTITSKDRPTAASHAANTSRTIGSIVISVKCMLRAIVVPRMNRDSIIPSKHKREDMRWDR